MSITSRTLSTLSLLCLCLLGGQLTFGEEKATSVASPPAKEPLVEQYLLSGKLAAGEQAMVARLKEHPQDDEARFGLGTIQFLRGIERLSQSFYRYGLQNQRNTIAAQLPFLRLVVPPNEKPEEVTYEKLRAVFETLLTDLDRAEKTLAQVKSSDVKLRLHFARIRLDLNGDGKATTNEMLWDIYTRFNRNVRPPRPPRVDRDIKFSDDPEVARRQIKELDDADKKLAKEWRSQAGQAEEWSKQFAITFDKSDAIWLQGYCNLLMAFDQFILAHDWKEAFNRTGHMAFPNIKAGYQYLSKPKNKRFLDSANIADSIAFIHLLRFPVVEQKRKDASLKHFEKVFRLSRLMWKEVEAETDDAEEWIPSPTQKGVFPNLPPVTKEIIKDWHLFLDEAEAIFAGKKLIPHWRVNDGRGFNLRKYFTDAKRFDLVLLVQGTDAKPFLEKGTLTEKQFWERLQRTFRGNFINFAIWFN